MSKTSPSSLTAATLTALGFNSASSTILEDTSVPADSEPRKHYLAHPHHAPPPLIAHSAIVPVAFVEHLMRNKKDSALGVKFEPDNDPLDRITNMEGALHTYVTPVLLARMHGDYRFRGAHGVRRFPATADGFQRGRKIVLSAAVQPDFEDENVMVALAALEAEPVVGTPLPADFAVLDATQKQDPARRAAYDAQIRSHLIAHLTHDGALPAFDSVPAASILSVDACCALLSDLITTPSPPAHLDAALRGMHVRLHGGAVVSLELLCTSAQHQARTELAALDALCAAPGYAYTSDPPAIFARAASATLLNRVQVLALARLARAEGLPARMRVFAFNDYADAGAVPLARAALAHVPVVARAELFGAADGAYVPLVGAEGALLVLHNNSDAFGQNIETEPGFGSLDGAVGANCSGAASLRRDRADLLAYRLRVEVGDC